MVAYFETNNYSKKYIYMHIFLLCVYAYYQIRKASDVGSRAVSFCFRLPGVACAFGCWASGSGDAGRQQPGRAPCVACARLAGVPW